MNYLIILSNLLIILWGQSNMDGRGLYSSLDANYSGDIENAYILDSTEFVQLNCLDSNNNQFPTKYGTFGIEMPMTYEAVNNLGYDTVFVIKHAIGGTYLTAYGGNNTYDPANSLGLFPYFNSVVNNGVNILNDRFDKSIFVAYQGESETTNETLAEQWTGKAETLIDTLRTKTGLSDMLCVFIRIPNKLPPSAPTEHIREAQSLLIGNRENTVLYNVDTYTLGDDLHQTGLNLQSMGVNIARTYLQKNTNIKIGK